MMEKSFGEIGSIKWRVVPFHDCKRNGDGIFWPLGILPERMFAIRDRGFHSNRCFSMEFTLRTKEGDYRSAMERYQKPVYKGVTAWPN